MGWVYMLHGLLLALPFVAAADPEWVECAPKTSLITQYGGFSDVLFCGEERVRAILVRFQGPDGVIDGLSWNEYQGPDKYRSFQLYDTGVIAFVVQDKTVDAKNFWKASRGTSYMVFPRGGTFAIRQHKTSRKVIVRDQHGIEWHLMGGEETGSYGVRFEYMKVEALNGKPMPAVPIDFSERGIVGVDLAAAGVFYLQHNRGSFSGLAKLDTPAYRKLRSTLHDGRGKRCKLPNGQLYVNSDPNEVLFRFWTDSELTAFLAERCPQLDLAPLKSPGARLPLADAPAELLSPPKEAARTNAGARWLRLVEARDTRRPQPADAVEVRYAAWATDGRSVIGGSGGMQLADRVEALNPAIAAAVVDMGEGEKRRLWLPPEQTLGKNPPRPERAGALIVEIELVRIH